MIGLSVGLMSPGVGAVSVQLPSGFGWDVTSYPIEVSRIGASYTSGIAPRSLVDPNIWTGPAIHVDPVAGDDSNSGIGAFDGDFQSAKRTIHAAFVEGNATGSAYRVIAKAGQYAESAFTRNGNEEPTAPVAIIGWGGQLHYRTGPFSVNWSAQSGTYSADVSSVKRAFRTDVLTEQGLYTELQRAPDLATCTATSNSFFDDAGVVHVNIGAAPGPSDVALMRSFHGARFLSHVDDLYLENVTCEGGITGALHCDPAANRNVVGVNCRFRYSAPSNLSVPLDAARVRRTNGLVAFFDSDASGGGKDGWSFHEDGVPGMHVLVQNCSGYSNGALGATSVNGFTTHDGVRSIVLNSDFGFSNNGAEVHCIQTTQTWLAGTRATARDPDGSSVAFKCSNQATMWLQNTVADAQDGATNLAIEANGGTVFTKDHQAVAGTVSTSNGGSVTPF